MMRTIASCATCGWKKRVKIPSVSSVVQDRKNLAREYYESNERTRMDP